MMRVELPGFGEVMRAESMKITPNAILSRNLAAVVDQALVIALPGSRAALWNVSALCKAQSRMASRLRNARRRRAETLGTHLVRPDQQAHQLRAIVREMRVCSAARNYIASEIGTLRRTVFLRSLPRAALHVVGWFNSQGHRNARTRLPMTIHFVFLLRASRDTALANRNAAPSAT